MTDLIATQRSAASVSPTVAEPAQYLTFMLGGEAFAIGILSIKEIIEYQGLTTVPMMPECVRGVINLRGAVVPVIDLQARLGRRSSEVTKRTCIVIVEVQGEDERQVVGVVVDVVNEVLEIAPADIEPAPTFGARIRTDFIAGMGKVRGKFVILLDVDTVLAIADELIGRAGAAHEPAVALT
ncbi:chemotaxis protein CheW [Caldimonas brevitalea]|uniref:Chemotaxis protein CheW n=1 Tax=Caldimonas brevitalea TaxID=413882 RepID=A0A0G3BI54_9BURK|nr:chemotaxis protein CheW [Caldimonas brevitalea]AKJ27673.1 chemotaxis protein CheW [Caldimonas brevitalea]